MIKYVIFGLLVGLAMSQQDRCSSAKTLQQCKTQSSVFSALVSNCLWAGDICTEDPCTKEVTSTSCAVKGCLWAPYLFDTSCVSPDLICFRYDTQTRCTKSTFCKWDADFCQFNNAPRCAGAAASNSTGNANSCQSFPAVNAAALIILFVGVLAADMFLLFIMKKRGQQSVSKIQEQNEAVDHLGNFAPALQDNFTVKSQPYIPEESPRRAKSSEGPSPSKEEALLNESLSKMM